MVGVALEGKCGSCTLSEGLEVAYGLAALREQGGASYAGDRGSIWGETGPFQERLEAPVHDVLRVEGLTVPGGEHRAPVLVRGTGGELLSFSWRLWWLLGAPTALPGGPRCDSGR